MYFYIVDKTTDKIIDQIFLNQGSFYDIGETVTSLIEKNNCKILVSKDLIYINQEEKECISLLLT